MLLASSATNGKLSVGSYEANKAGDAVAALKKSLKPNAVCKRDGKFNNIDATLLVPVRRAASHCPESCAAPPCRHVLLVHGFAWRCAQSTLCLRAWNFSRRAKSLRSPCRLAALAQLRARYL